MTALTQIGQVFWLFGLSGAGKSTLASGLIADLRSLGLPVLALDGDALRAGLCRGLGFSDADRAENLRRAAEVAKLGTASGLCVVASFITPLESHRQLVADLLGPTRVSFIHVSASLEVCRTRDTKGLYARAEAGRLPQMTGVSSGFEAPRRPDLVISTEREPSTTSAATLSRFARTRLGLAQS